MIAVLLVAMLIAVFIGSIILFRRHFLTTHDVGDSFRYIGGNGQWFEARIIMRRGHKILVDAPIVRIDEN